MTWKAKLYKYSYNNDEVKVRKLLESKEVIKELPKTRKWKPEEAVLHMTASNGKMDILKMLIDSGADVNSVVMTNG